MGQLILTSSNYKGLLLLLAVVFTFACLSFRCVNNNDGCKKELTLKIKETASAGKGLINLSEFNCLEWQQLVIVEPYFYIKDLKEFVVNSDLPSEMLSKRTNDSYFHLLFLDSDKNIQLYLPISSFDIDFSKMVTGKKSYRIIEKEDAILNIYTSDEKIYKSDKFLIRASLVEH